MPHLPSSLEEAKRKEAEDAKTLEQVEALRQAARMSQQEQKLRRLEYKRRVEEESRQEEMAAAQQEEEARRQLEKAEEATRQEEARRQAEGKARRQEAFKRQEVARLDFLRVQQERARQEARGKRQAQQAELEAQITAQEERVRQAEEQKRADAERQRAEEQARHEWARKEEEARQKAWEEEMERARQTQQKNREALLDAQRLENERLKEAMLAQEEYERREEEEEAKQRKRTEEERTREEEESTRSQEEGEEQEAEESRWTLLREGLPTSILLRRSGDLYIASPSSLSNKLAKLFEVRLQLCRDANLRDDAVLPVSTQKRGQKVLFDQWCESIAGQKKFRLVISATTPMLRNCFSLCCNARFFEHNLLLCCGGWLPSTFYLCVAISEFQICPRSVLQRQTSPGTQISKEKQFSICAATPESSNVRGVSDFPGRAARLERWQEEGRDVLLLSSALLQELRQRGLDEDPFGARPLQRGSHSPGQHCHQSTPRAPGHARCAATRPCVHCEAGARLREDHQPEEVANRLQEMG